MLIDCPHHHHRQQRRTICGFLDLHHKRQRKHKTPSTTAATERAAAVSRQQRPVRYIQPAESVASRVRSCLIEPYPAGRCVCVYVAEFRTDNLLSKCAARLVHVRILSQMIPENRPLNADEKSKTFPLCHHDISAELYTVKERQQQYIHRHMGTGIGSGGGGGDLRKKLLLLLLLLPFLQAPRPKASEGEEFQICAPASQPASQSTNPTTDQPSQATNRAGKLVRTSPPSVCDPGMRSRLAKGGAEANRFNNIHGLTPTR